RLVVGVVLALAEEVAERVDAERRVVEEEDARRAAPEHPGQPAVDRAAAERDAEPERKRDAGDDPHDESAVDEADHRVVDQVARSSRLVLKLRCVSRRWKPTVTPEPMRTYVTTSTTMSRHPTTPPQPSAMPIASSTGGAAVTTALAARSTTGIATGRTSLSAA